MLVDHERGREDEQPRLVDLDPALGEVTDDLAVLEQRLAERLFALVRRAQEGEVERPGREAERTHAVVQATGAETSLDDLEAATPTEDEVRSRHADVLVLDLVVTFRRVVVAKHGHGADELDTRSVARDEDDTLLVVLVGLRVPVYAQETRSVPVTSLERAARGETDDLPMTMWISFRGSPAPEIHHLWPLTTISFVFSSRTIEVRMLVALFRAQGGSVPTFPGHIKSPADGRRVYTASRAESGMAKEGECGTHSELAMPNSVMAKLERILPSMRGLSQRSFCSALP